MAAVRAILTIAGRSKLANPHHERLSNHALGLSGASREGTKIAMFTFLSQSLDKLVYIIWLGRVKKPAGRSGIYLHVLLYCRYSGHFLTLCFIQLRF
ncbi:hypothetical protein VY86_12440 [Photorhabdus thracensis]|uniref:Uncharacterized protein n=1 Tax=Photorhabdus thracensis TaxID=230089 RepID=A0A0F7LNB4_9GAMM|nr:hypothetical protein VY86_12440 [Photorhabdus thracensis]